MPQVNYVRETRAFLHYAVQNQLSANEMALWHAIFEKMNQHAVGSLWPDGFVPMSNSSLLALTPFGTGKSGEQTLMRTRQKLVKTGLIMYQPGRRHSRVPCYRVMYFEARAEKEPERVTWQNKPPVAAGSRDTLAEQLYDLREDEAGRTRAQESGLQEGFAYSGVDELLARGAFRAPGCEGKNEGKESLSNQGETGPLPERAEGKDEGKDEGKPVDVYVNLNLNPNGTKVPASATAGGGAARQAPQDLTLPGFDGAWRTSARARGAVAQRLLDAYTGARDRPDAWEQFCHLLQTGVSPQQILAMYPQKPSLHGVICRLLSERDLRDRAQTAGRAFGRGP